MLLHYGAEPMLGSKPNGDNCLHIAARSGNYAVLCELLASDKIYGGGHVSMVHSIPDAINKNVDQRNRLGQTPLHVACQLGRCRAARALLMAGADRRVTIGWLPFFRTTCEDLANQLGLNHLAEHGQLTQMFLKPSVSSTPVLSDATVDSGSTVAATCTWMAPPHLAGHRLVFDIQLQSQGQSDWIHRYVMGPPTDSDHDPVVSAAVSTKLLHIMHRLRHPKSQQNLPASISTLQLSDSSVKRPDLQSLAAKMDVESWLDSMPTIPAVGRSSLLAEWRSMHCKCVWDVVELVRDDDLKHCEKDEFGPFLDPVWKSLRIIRDDKHITFGALIDRLASLNAAHAALHYLSPADSDHLLHMEKWHVCGCRNHTRGWRWARLEFGRDADTPEYETVASTNADAPSTRVRVRITGLPPGIYKCRVRSAAHVGKDPEWCIFSGTSKMLKTPWADVLRESVELSALPANADLVGSDEARRKSFESTAMLGSRDINPLVARHSIDSRKSLLPPRGRS
jgi:hypothetical protein